MESALVQTGGSRRTYYDVLKKYGPTLLNCFHDGYVSGPARTVYLLPLHKFSPIDENQVISAAEVAKIKQFTRLGSERWAPADLQTTPIFYMYKFAAELTNFYNFGVTEGAKGTPLSYKKLLEAKEAPSTNPLSGEEFTNLVHVSDIHFFGLLEIMTRLYILSYLMIFKQTELCLDPQPAGATLYDKYIKMKTRVSFDEFLRDLQNNLNQTQKCIFGNDTADTDQNFELLCDMMLQQGMLFIGSKYDEHAFRLRDMRKTYFFDSMVDFLAKMRDAPNMKSIAIPPLPPPPPPPPTPPPVPTEDECTTLKKAIDAAITSKAIKDKIAITQADITALNLDKKYTIPFIIECLSNPMFGGYALDPSITPPPPSGLTEADKKLIEGRFIYNNKDTTLWLNIFDSAIEEFIKGKDPKFTVAAVKSVIIDKFKKLNRVPNFINKTIVGAPIRDYAVQNVKGDGWCFYYAILRQRMPNDFTIQRPPANIGNPIPDEVNSVKRFLTGVKTYIQRNPEYNHWKEIYDIISKPGEYNRYIENLDNDVAKEWADPDFGIGETVAFGIVASIHIIQYTDSTHQHIVQIAEYTPDTSLYTPANIDKLRDDKIYVLYIDKNHYQILTPNNPRIVPPPRLVVPPQPPQPPPPASSIFTFTLKTGEFIPDDIEFVDTTLPRIPYKVKLVTGFPPPPMRRAAPPSIPSIPEDWTKNIVPRLKPNKIYFSKINNEEVNSNDAGETSIQKLNRLLTPHFPRGDTYQAAQRDIVFEFAEISDKDAADETAAAAATAAATAAAAAAAGAAGAAAGAASRGASRSAGGVGALAAARSRSGGGATRKKRHHSYPLKGTYKSRRA
jgi:hypothetical protein